MMQNNGHIHSWILDLQDQGVCRHCGASRDFRKPLLKFFERVARQPARELSVRTRKDELL